MSAALHKLAGSNVRLVMTDGSNIVGRVASVDERFNVAIKGARDSALAGTPLERASADSVRIVRGETITGVFSVDQ